MGKESVTFVKLYDVLNRRSWEVNGSPGITRWRLDMQTDTVSSVMAGNAVNSVTTVTHCRTSHHNDDVQRHEMKCAYWLVRWDVSFVTFETSRNGVSSLLWLVWVNCEEFYRLCFNPLGCSCPLYLQYCNKSCCCCYYYYYYYYYFQRCRSCWACRGLTYLVGVLMAVSSRSLLSTMFDVGRSLGSICSPPRLAGQYLFVDVIYVSHVTGEWMLVRYPWNVVTLRWDAFRHTMSLYAALCLGSFCIYWLLSADVYTATHRLQWSRSS